MVPPFFGTVETTFRSGLHLGSSEPLSHVEAASEGVSHGELNILGG